MVEDTASASIQCEDLNAAQPRLSKTRLMEDDVVARDVWLTWAVSVDDCRFSGKDRDRLGANLLARIEKMTMLGKSQEGLLLGL